MYTFKPRGVCSNEMRFDLEDGKIKDVEIKGGCNGNLQAVCALIKGKDARETAEILKGIRCGVNKTSCPDQLSIALLKALEIEEKQKGEVLFESNENH